MRLTTEPTRRRGGTGGAFVARRSGRRGGVPAASLAAAVVALGLAVSASPSSASSGTGSSGTASSGSSGTASSGTALRKAAARASGRPVGEVPAASQAQPVAVAVVERPDGTLTVETHEAGSVAAAARVARRLGERPGVVASGVDHTVHALVSPGDDDLYGCQWALQSADSSCSDLVGGGLVLGRRTLKAASAWSRSTGAGVTVAVVDSGVRSANPDLVGSVLIGHDVFSATHKGRFDGYGHGTHVAGIVAARDNDRGGLGLAPGAKILPVRVLDSHGEGSDATVADGIVWAVDHGADVINLSLGGTYPSSVQEAAVNYALAKGVLVVASAGNSREEGNPTLYPAAIPGVLAVAATGYDGYVSTFSERKAYVGIAAPGENIVSTCFDTSSPEPDAPDLCWDVAGGDPNYAWLSGTSMAAPFVSAAAALLLEENPGLSPAALGAYLTGTATPAGAVGRDTSYGFGHLNPNAALDQVIGAASRPTNLALIPNPSTVTSGSKVTLTAKFASQGWRLARRGVQFQKYSDGAWRTFTSVTTDGSGVAAHAVPVVVNAKFRVSVRATAGLAASVSATKSVAVKAKVTIKASSPSADQLRVSVAVAPQAAVKASLQRKVGGGWRTISSRTTTGAGAVTFARSAPSGTQSFRVVVGSSSLAGGGISNVVTLTVK